MKKLILTGVWTIFFSSTCAMDAHFLNITQKPSDSFQEVQTIRTLEDNVLKVIENPTINSEKADEITFRMQTADMSPIEQSSDDILLLDISERREKTMKLYDKFLSYAELFGRTGLDLKETLDDLNAIKNWLEKTHIDAILMRYGHFEFPQHLASEPAFFGDRITREVNLGFSGQAISKPLFDARARLQAEIGGEKSKGYDVTLVQSQLNDIFQKDPQADMFLLFRLTFYSNVGEILWHNNYNKDYGSICLKWIDRWWGRIEGIFRQICEPWPSGWEKRILVFPWADPSSYGWNPLYRRIPGDPSYRGDPFAVIYRKFCAPRRDAYLNETIFSIKQRALALFDFETNSQSELQKFYKQTGISPSSTLPFPSVEIDNLIRKFNDFVERRTSH